MKPHQDEVPGRRESRVSAYGAREEQAWQQVLARDAGADGRFVYGVSTTGIVCRPSCPSRRPARANIRFFASVDEALRAGYRACLRCQPAGAHIDAQRVEQLCKHLQKHVGREVTLRELGALAGLSSFATQRLFGRVMGVSPRYYQLSLRSAKMRSELSSAKGVKGTMTITEAIYSAGYAGGSRFYEEGTAKLGMKPSHFREGGAGETIEACVLPCAFGFLLVARTARGLCHVALGDSAQALEAEWRLRFENAALTLHPQVRLHADVGTPSALQTAVEAVLSLLTEHPSTLDLPLDLRATAFQERVWQALRAIPRGQTRSYRQVAEEIGTPSAARAVARACATNTLALVIPCHRVIGSDGELRGYKWGTQRKRELLAMEKQ